MKELIKINGAVIVEGKYDKIHLENFIDALIIPTGGFRLFKDKEKMNLIKAVAKTQKIIVMTDSDNAGRLIRSYLKQCINSENIVNVYLPKIEGKEKRKSRHGAEGILGVEGISGDIILEALEKSGVTAERTQAKGEKITNAQLYRYGLSGKTGSSELRKDFLSFIGLPDNLTTPAMLDYINCTYTHSKFLEEIEKWQSNRDKR